MVPWPCVFRRVVGVQAGVMGCAGSHALDASAEDNLHMHLDLMFELYGKPTEQVLGPHGHIP